MDDFYDLDDVELDYDISSYIDDDFEYDDDSDYEKFRDINWDRMI